MAWAAHHAGRFPQIKDFSRQNVRVLLSLDADKIDLSRKGVKRTDKDFAVIWAKSYGKGVCSTTASATFKPSGSVLIFRKCGLRWCSGRWA